MTHKQHHREQNRILIAAFAMMGILADSTDLPKVRRNGKKLSCRDSVSYLAVKQADSLMKELGV